jgi:hypothetical protein
VLSVKLTAGIVKVAAVAPATLIVEVTIAGAAGMATGVFLANTAGAGGVQVCSETYRVEARTKNNNAKLKLFFPLGSGVRVFSRAFRFYLLILIRCRKLPVKRSCPIYPTA